MNVSRFQRSAVVKHTGCQVPCTYIDYEYIKGREMKVEDRNNSLLFMLNFAETIMTVKKEVLTYPFTSFLAELGGALGMFLGFSLLMIWDYLKVCLYKY